MEEARRSCAGYAQRMRLRREPHLLGHDAPHLRSGGKPSIPKTRRRTIGALSKAQRRAVYELPGRGGIGCRNGENVSTEVRDDPQHIERDRVFVSPF